MIQQVEFSLRAYRRGYHIITDEVMQQLPELPRMGLLHLFIKHTSAGLTINENADPSVRVDYESIFNHIVPENLPFLKHTIEGPDDMPAHIKSSLVGSSITIPITNGRLNLGTWQGIYLCEFRNHGGNRKLVATIHGQDHSFFSKKYVKKLIIDSCPTFWGFTPIDKQPSFVPVRRKPGRLDPICNTLPKTRKCYWENTTLDSDILTNFNTS